MSFYHIKVLKNLVFVGYAINSTLRHLLKISAKINLVSRQKKNGKISKLLRIIRCFVLITAIFLEYIVYSVIRVSRNPFWL